MYLHLGQSVVVTFDSVVGVFDLDNTTGSRITRDLLRRAEREGRVETVTSELPRSFVLCSENGEQKIYLSQLTTATLLKRSEGGGSGLQE
jgi:hypothetical protein